MIWGNSDSVCVRLCVPVQGSECVCIDYWELRKSHTPGVTISGKEALGTVHRAFCSFRLNLIKLLNIWRIWLEGEKSKNWSWLPQLALSMECISRVARVHLALLVTNSILLSIILAISGGFPLTLNSSREAPLAGTPINSVHGAFSLPGTLHCNSRVCLCLTPTRRKGLWGKGPFNVHRCVPSTQDRGRHRVAQNKFIKLKKNQRMNK